MGKRFIKRRSVITFCLLLGIILSTFFHPSSAWGKKEVVPFVVATANGPSKLDPIDAYDSESIETIMQVAEGLYIYNYSSSEVESIPLLADSMDTLNLEADDTKFKNTLCYIKSQPFTSYILEDLSALTEHT